jgi:hypothetical protein
MNLESGASIGRRLCESGSNAQLPKVTYRLALARKLWPNTSWSSPGAWPLKLTAVRVVDNSGESSRLLCKLGQVGQNRHLPPPLSLGIFRRFSQTDDCPLRQNEGRNVQRLPERQSNPAFGRARPYRSPRGGVSATRGRFLQRTHHFGRTSELRPQQVDHPLRQIISASRSAQQCRDMT